MAFDFLVGKIIKRQTKTRPVCVGFVPHLKKSWRDLS